jgi:hypothetical protein
MRRVRERRAGAALAVEPRPRIGRAAVRVVHAPLAVVGEEDRDEDVLVRRHVEEPAEEEVGPQAAAELALAAAGAWFGGKSATHETGSKGTAGVFMPFPLFRLPFLSIGVAILSSLGRAARSRASRDAAFIERVDAMQYKTRQDTRPRESLLAGAGWSLGRS